MMILLVSLLFTAPESAAESTVTDMCKKVVASFNRCGEKDPVVQFVEGKDQVTINKGGKIVETLPCSDGLNLKNFERMNNMDIVSVVAVPYRTGEIELPVQEVYNDPGRFRPAKLLYAVYGASEKEVSAQLTKVKFLGQNVSFHSKNGAAASLAKVSERLEELAKTDKDAKKFLEPFLSKKFKGQTYNWRPIAGTSMVSMHSFGLAVDLLTGKEPLPTYWLWDAASKAGVAAKDLKEADIGESYKADKMYVVPNSIVEAFEAEGFIWGGKWQHFDSMHFEYRPEQLPELPACP